MSASGQHEFVRGSGGPDAISATVGNSNGALPLTLSGERVFRLPVSVIRRAQAAWNNGLNAPNVLPLPKREGRGEGAGVVLISKRQPAHLRRQRAFSLIEVMCAILVLGIGLFGLTQGLTTALRSSKDAEVQTTAALIAAGQIEILRADGFVIEGETEGACGEGLDNYEWRQNVTRTDIDGLYEVAVEVINANSGQSLYTLRTLFFDVTGLSGSSTPSQTQNQKRGGRRS